MIPDLRQTLLCAAALFAAAFALYSPSLDFGYVEYDDYRILQTQPKLFNEDSFSDSVVEIFTDLPREEPLLLRDISWALDARIFGLGDTSIEQDKKEAFGFHLGNVLLNAFNVALLFIFLLLATQAFRFSLISAAFWGVLVVHVEPVCWVMGRKDVLCTFFMLGALIGHLCFLRSKSTKHRRLFYLLAVLCTAGSLFSKMAALPLFILLGLLTFFHGYLNGKQAADAPLDLLAHLEKLLWKLLPLIPYIILCFGVFVWYSGVLREFAVEHHTKILDRGPDPWAPEHIWTMTRILPIIMAMYLKYIFTPFEHPLAWDWPNASIPLTTTELVGSLLFAAAIVAVMVRLFLRRKDLFFAAAAFFVLMIPYMNIMYIGIWIANRYAYLSSACLVCILVWLGAKAYQKSGSGLRQGIIAIAAAYFVLSCVQNFIEQQRWRNERAFWQYEVALKNPSILSTQNIPRIYLMPIKKLDDKKEKTKEDVAQRKEYVDEAKASLAKGLQNYAALGIKQTDYHADQHGYYARHHYYLGRYANINKESLQVQLKHYAKAYELRPKSRSVLFAMGDTHINMAGRLLRKKRISQADKLAHQAMDFYTDLITGGELPSKDKAHAKFTMGNVKKHFSEQQFPALRKRIKELERILQAGPGSWK